MLSVRLSEQNSEKFKRLARETGKSPNDLVNGVLEHADPSTVAGMAVNADEEEAKRFAEWRSAVDRVAGIWADRDDLPDFDEIRRSLDRDVWGRGS